jgi:hypothetical protein
VIVAIVVIAMIVAIPVMAVIVVPAVMAAVIAMVVATIVTATVARRSRGLWSWPLPGLWDFRRDGHCHGHCHGCRRRGCHCRDRCRAWNRCANLRDHARGKLTTHAIAGEGRSTHEQRGDKNKGHWAFHF